MEMHFFHITWTTYNSRTSDRMRRYNVKKGLPVLLTADDEVEVAGYIRDIVKADQLRILAFNICIHHLHMIILCDINSRDKIVQKMKAVSSRKYLNRRRNTNAYSAESGTGHSATEIPKHLWAQKYNWTAILSDEQLSALYDYVVNNRIKHNLPVNNELDSVIKKIITPYDKIFEGIDFGLKFSDSSEAKSNNQVSGTRGHDPLS